MINIIKTLKPSEVYILKIENNPQKETILNDIPRNFPSVECLRGFISGYGFDKIMVLPLEDYVDKHNSVYSKKLNFFIKAVSIIEVE